MEYFSVSDVDLFKYIRKTEKYFDNLLESIYWGYLLRVSREIHKAGKDIDKVEPQTIKFEFPYTIEKLGLLVKKYDLDFNQVFLTALTYYKIESISQKNELEKVYNECYYEEISKLLELIKGAGKSSIYVGIGHKSVKIKNSNEWLTKHLQSFLEDYIITIPILEKSTGAKIKDEKRKYYQYTFSDILFTDKKKKMKGLKFLNEFMLELNLIEEPIEYDLMKSEFQYRPKGMKDYSPIQKNISGVKTRVEAIRNGTTYTKIDDVIRYKSDSSLLNILELDEIYEGNVEERVNNALNILASKKIIYYNATEKPLIKKKTEL